MFSPLKVFRYTVILLNFVGVLNSIYQRVPHSWQFAYKNFSQVGETLIWQFAYKNFGLMGDHRVGH